jgi:hypothetical protein
LPGRENIVAFQKTRQLMWAKHPSKNGVFHELSIIRNPFKRLRRSPQAGDLICFSIA